MNQRMCFKCATAPVGPGGVLCPGCKARIEAAQPAPQPRTDHTTATTEGTTCHG